MIQDCDTLDLIWLSAAGETAPAILQQLRREGRRGGVHWAVGEVWFGVVGVRRGGVAAWVGRFEFRTRLSKNCEMRMLAIDYILQ